MRHKPKCRTGHTLPEGVPGRFCEKCGSSLKWRRLFGIWRLWLLGGCIGPRCENYYKRGDPRTMFEAIMETHVNRAGALKLFRALRPRSKLDVDGKPYWVVSAPTSAGVYPDGHLEHYVKLRDIQGKEVNVSFDDLVVHLSK